MLIAVSCSKKQETPLPAERTVIVYMVADNSLNSQVDKDLNEMELGWDKTNNGRLVVYVDQSRKTPYVLEIVPDRTSGVVSPEVIKYGEQNSCSIEVMNKVLSDIKQRYPAKSYGLILWSHASGWLPAPSPTTRVFGEDGNNTMEIYDLAKLSGKYEFIAFDACNMSGIEVVYELRNCTEYLLASVTEVLEGGFPYDRIISHLFKPKADIVAVAQEFMTYYRNYYYPAGAMTVTDVRKINELAAITASIIKKYGAAIADIDLSAIQKYEKELIFFDFKDYIEAIAGNTPEWQSFVAALNAAVIFEDHTPQILDIAEIQRSCGLNCYIPGHYPALDFYYQRIEWFNRVYK
jgi:hypothetical protein